MHKSNEDCFFFLTSTCAKGSACTYRHSPLALTCNVICPSWLRGNCLDPACPFRHSAVQRPMVSNGILCFYENTPTGCLKPECTFIHSRPRVNLKNPATIRPSSTNLIKNDATKPIVNNTPATNIPQTTSNATPSVSNTNPSPATTNETQSVVVPVTINQSSSNPDTSSPITKTEIIPRRIALSSDNTELSNEKINSTNNNNTSLTVVKPTTRSVITDTSKTNPEETTTPSRLVVNRNVVLSEPPAISNRTIVQTTSSSSSNRVVVSSDSINASPLKSKKKGTDVIEQENETKKFKSDSSSIIDIPFPCSAPSITNRLLVLSSKESPTTNDTKPVRLRRDRLLASNPSSSGNSPISVSTPSNEEKTSAGTGLSQDEERRSMRIERFQKKPISPSQSVTGSSSTNITNGSTNRNVITTTSNERKRTAPETITKDLPPSKRLTTSSSDKQSSPSQRTSSVDVSINSSSSPLIRNKHTEKQINESATKNMQDKKSSTETPMAPSAVRPRFTPQPITPPSPLQQSSSSPTKSPRLCQPPSFVTKLPLASVATPSQTSTKPVEQVSSSTASVNTSPSTKTTMEKQPSNAQNEEDENQLLKLNESADVVDTFALIDEALLEADHLLELM